MEAGKSRLKGDVLKDATKSEVKSLKSENTRLKELLGKHALDIQLLKKVWMRKERLALRYG